MLSPSGFAGGCVVLATTLLYLAIIDSQGTSGVSVLPWVLVLTVSGLLAVVAAWLPSARARSRIFAATAAAMVAVGLLAIFSIGMFLLVGGGLLARAALKASRTRAK